MEPMLKGFAGISFDNSNITDGLKGFFSPLISNRHTNVVVAGGGLELNYKFE